MLRITCFVDDKNAAAAIHALNGIAYEFQIAPVANAKASGGKLIAKTSGTLCDLFANWLVKVATNKPLTAADIRKFCVEHGRAPSSVAVALKCGKDHGFLKQTGKSRKTAYHVDMAKVKAYLKTTEGAAK